MIVEIGNDRYEWAAYPNAIQCCGVINPARLYMRTVTAATPSTTTAAPAHWAERVDGDFPDFVSAFLYWMYINGNYIYAISSVYRDYWHTQLIKNLGPNMELELANGQKIKYKCTFSGWHRNPHSGNKIQVITIRRE